MDGLTLPSRSVPPSESNKNLSISGNSDSGSVYLQFADVDNVFVACNYAPGMRGFKELGFLLIYVLFSSWVMTHSILVAIASLAFHRITRFAKGVAARSTDYGLGWVVYVTAVVRSWFSFSAVTCTLATTSSNISNEE
jgi:hypothetical protein